MKLAILTALFILLVEIFFSNSKPKYFLGQIFWVFVNLILLQKLISFFLTNIFYYFDKKVEVMFFDISSTSLFLQFVSFFILFDLIKYFIHLLFHKNKYLWKFHSVHHSVEKINSLSSFTHTWLEALLNIALTLPIGVLLHINNKVVLFGNTLAFSVCLWQYTNLKFLDKIDFIEGDFTNLEVAQEAVKGVDFVLHHGAIPSVPRSGP